MALDNLPLTPLISATLGGIAGFASALLQERLRRRTRFRSVAAALHVEACRIEDELRAMASDAEDYLGVATVTPAVHRWLERTVVDSAEMDPGLVAEFLLLERLLHNAAVYWEKTTEAHGRLREAEQENSAVQPGGEAGPRAADRHPIPVLQKRLALMRKEFNRTRSAALLTVGQIRNRLERHLPRPAGSSRAT
jgi:hypothetical protein